MIQAPDTPKKSKKVTWIDGASSSKTNGTGLRDPTQAMPSATCLNPLRELRAKWKAMLRKRKNPKNIIKKMPKKKRKTFTIGSDDSSLSEYETNSDTEVTDFNPSSDGWSSDDDVSLSQDPQWDDFMAKLLINHRTPNKATSTQRSSCKAKAKTPRNSPSPAEDTSTSD